METYDILFKDSREVVEKGFNIKDKEKAIRMAIDMLTRHGIDPVESACVQSCF